QRQSLRPQEQQESRPEKSLGGPEKRQPKAFSRKRAIAFGKRTFEVQGHKPQEYKQGRRREDLFQLAEITQEKEARKRQSPAQDVDKQRIAQHHGRAGVDDATDQRRHPEVALQGDQ